MMKKITTFVSGLLLSAALLLPGSIRAAELQPFFTLKLASVNSLVSVAEKFSTMAGFADDAEFREFITTVRGMKGINPNEMTGIAAVVVDGEINLMLLLPITDLWGAEIPGFSDVFDMVRPFLSRRGEGQFAINSPFGTYIAVQKKDYLVITLDNIADQVPADPKKLFADLEKYTLGSKLDLEQVEFELIEANVFGPAMMFIYMQNPEVAEQFENVIEMYRGFYKEFSTIVGGIAINPQTADVEYSGTLVPRKGSDWGKMLAGAKRQPTKFDGFRGTPNNIVFSLGDSSSLSNPIDVMSMPSMELAMQQYETLLNAALEQIDADDETGEIGKFAREVFDSIRKIIELESKSTTADYASSLNTEGTLLFAMNTNALGEIRNFASLLGGFAAPKVNAIAGDLNIDINAAVKRDYVTVEGYKVSSFQFPMDKIPAPEAAEALKGLSPGVFWAVNETSGKQAIAVAAGLDFAKTEQSFKAALEKTKTLVPVQQPPMTLSVQGLGKLLQQTFIPIAEKAGAPADELATFKTVVGILASAENDATITVDMDMKPDRMGFGYHISGKAIQAIISAVKAAAEDF